MIINNYYIKIVRIKNLKLYSDTIWTLSSKNRMRNIIFKLIYPVVRYVKNRIIT